MINVGIVGSAQAKLHFVKNAWDDKSCPAESDACQDKAYLVPGDMVVIGKRFKEFSCVIFSGLGGGVKLAWVPTASVESRAALATPRLADWTGNWGALSDTPHFAKETDQWAKIKILRGVKGSINICGEKWHIIRTGDAPRSGVPGPASLNPGSTMIEFVDGDNKAPILRTFENGQCVVRFMRIDNYLLVEDNGYCGGMGITFSGLYRC